MRSDRELTATALHSLANYMETGNIHLSRNDAIERGISVRELDEEQLKDVARLRELADEAEQELVGTVFQLPMYARVGGPSGPAVILTEGSTYYRHAGQWSVEVRVHQGRLCFFGSGRMKKHIQAAPLVAVTEQEWRDSNAGYIVG